MNLEKESKISSGNKRYLEFFLGRESYAVELLQVKEVITPPEVTPIPKSPNYVCGLMNLRGLVLTVIDLRKKLGVTPEKDTTQNAVIIFDLGERMVGVMVDSIHKVLNLPDSAIKPVPDADAQDSGHLLGILQNEARLTMWIDPRALLDGSIKTTSKVA